MQIRLRLAPPHSPRADQAVFTALTPVEGITELEIARGTVVVEHDGRVTIAQLREAIAVAGVEILEAEEDRRRLPTL